MNDNNTNVNNVEAASTEKKFEVRDLIEKGKVKGALSNAEIMEAIEEVDYDIEQIEKLYDPKL